VKGAAYEVRIAQDLMFITVGGKSRKYEVGEACRDPVILAPGGTALFSTAEKCCFAWDLAVIISIKWSLARQGLLVLTGGFVNPGFGLVQTGRRWNAADDERLHFYVINVGDRERVLNPGDAIASLSFLRVLGRPNRVPVESTQALIAESYGKYGALTGLGFLTRLAEHSNELKRLERRIGDVEKGLQPLISFGVYVVSAALLGVVATTLLTLLSTDAVRKAAEFVPRNWEFTVDLALFLTASLILLRIALWIFESLFRALRAPLRRLWRLIARDRR
jgi:deoxycytidine triphosphate deaminase